jgi:hypothetical protein
MTMAGWFEGDVTAKGDCRLCPCRQESRATCGFEWRDLNFRVPYPIASAGDRLKPCDANADAGPGRPTRLAFDERQLAQSRHMG